MIVSLLLSRVLGLIREMVMAGMFGADVSVDAFAIAFSVPDLLFFLIAGGALSSAFIPVFSEYLHTEREREAWHVFSVVVTVMSTVLVGVIALSMVFAPDLMRLVAPGAEGQKFEDAVFMSRILLPAQFAFFIGGILFGTLYARQVFAVPGLGPNIYNIGIILGAVFLGHVVQPGIAGMAWGALAGAILGNLVVPLFAMRKLGARFNPSFDLKHEGVRKVFKLMLPVVFGLSLPGVYDLFSRFFGSMFEVGVNSWLKYANVLMQAPLGVFGQSLAIAVFPALSQFYAQQRMDLYKDQLSATLRTTLYLSVPVSALFLVAAEPIVATIFQQGKFTAEDTKQVADLLRWYGIGVWAWCLHPVLMRAFFAVQNTVLPIVLGTATTVVFLGTVFALKDTVGYQILPIASSVAATGLVAALLIAVKAKIGDIDYKGLFVTLGKSTVASVAFAAITWGALQMPLAKASTDSKLAAIALLFIIALPGAWAYYFLTKAMGMPETRTLDRAMAKFNRRKASGTQEGG